MEKQDLGQLLRRNTEIVSNAITYGEAGIDELQNAIEIIKSGQYSKPRLRTQLLDIWAPVFWNDLYYQDRDNNDKTKIENSINELKSRFENDPDKEDTLTKLNFDKWLDSGQTDLENIKKKIELSAKLRELMQKESRDLETEFARLLQEHNELQANWKKEIEERDAKIEKELEEKRKRIIENQLQKQRILDKQKAEQKKQNIEIPLNVNCPTINEMYDSDLIFKKFNQYFKTDKSAFKNWLIDGTGDIKQMRWTYENENIGQLRAFLNELCYAEWKPKEINLAFKLKKTVDSNNRAGKLKLDLLTLLKQSEHKSKQSKHK